MVKCAAKPESLLPLSSRNARHSVLRACAPPRAGAEAAPPAVGFACGAGGPPWLLCQAGKWVWFPDLPQVSEMILPLAYKWGTRGKERDQACVHPSPRVLTSEINPSKLPQRA